MVRPKGLEPQTFWSVARRSIQLSYGRTSSLAMLLIYTVINKNQTIKRKKTIFYRENEYIRQGMLL